jgi:hypothetical protein
MIIEEIFGRTGHFSDRKEAISDIFHRFILVLIKLRARRLVPGIRMFIGFSNRILLDATRGSGETILLEIYLVYDVFKFAH